MVTAPYGPAPSASERRVRKLLVAVVVIGALLGAMVALPVVYFSGGGRLQVAHGFSTGPVEIGETLHLVVELVPHDGTIELQSTRVVAAEGLDVQMRLVRVGEGAAASGTYRGPPAEAFEPVPLEGHTLEVDDEDRYALDLTLTPTEPGEQTVESVEVTYDAGRFRTRTAKLRDPICVSGVEELPSPDGDPSEGCAH